MNLHAVPLQQTAHFCYSLPDMTSVPQAVVDVLNALLEAEAGSIFRFVGEGSPYLGQASAEVRKPLHELDEMSRRHERELAALIESVGGMPRRGSRVRPEEQYLAFLSIRFLLPKLVGEEQLLIQRYTGARLRIGPDHPQIVDALARIEAEQVAQLAVLQRAASDVTGGKFPSPGAE